MPSDAGQPQNMREVTWTPTISRIILFRDVHAARFLVRLLRKTWSEVPGLAWLPRRIVYS